MPKIDESKCLLCGGCVGVCPKNAMRMNSAGLEIDPKLCIECGICAKYCPVGAISEKLSVVSFQLSERLTTLANNANLITDNSYDVIIVGAGPAGSTAARFLAKAGARVLVIDKRQEIGAPKRCAEGIDITGLQNVGLEPDMRWAANEISGAVIYAPNSKSVALDAIDPKGVGYVLERKIFEKHLATLAISAGAKYLVKTEFTDLLRSGGAICGIKARGLGGEFAATAKIIIAADGRESKVAKAAGLDTANKLKDYHSGFQYEMAGLRGLDWRKLHIFFGNDAAPKGYIWIFPKSEGVANVGIGIIGTTSGEGHRAKDYLDKFIAEHPEIFGGASPIEINAGGVPVSSSVEKLAVDNLVLIGDAAQLVNPIHGGGIALAMHSGKLAAETALEALKEGNFSEKFLRRYEKRWEKTRGKRLRKLMKLRMFTERLDDNDLNALADILQGEDIMALTDAKFAGFLKLLVKNRKMLAIAVKYLKA